jgi:DNA-binding transcriptional LysR family regulator
MLFCASNHPLGRRQTVNWRELDGLPLITLTRESGIRLLVEVGFETVQIRLVPAYEVAQITTALAMVEAGLGIAVLPTYAWAGARAIKISAAALDPGIARDIVMITRAGRSIAPAVSAFARFLAKYTNVSVPGGAAAAARLPSARKPTRISKRTRK